MAATSVWSLRSDSSWIGLKSYSSKLIRHSGTDVQMPISSYSQYCSRLVNENQNQVFKLIFIAQENSSNRKGKLEDNGQPSPNGWASNPPKPIESSPKRSIQAKQHTGESQTVEERKRNLLLLTQEREAIFTDFSKQKEIPNDLLSANGRDEEAPKVDPQSDVKKGHQLTIDNRVFWKRFRFPSRKIRSIIVLNILTVVYASNIPVIKEAEAILDPSLFSVWRFAVASIPFIPFMFRAWRDVEIRTAGLELGFWVSVGYLTQGIGLLTTEAGRASFISAFTVIVVPLLDGLLGARIPKITWFGASVALLGIGLLESSGAPVTIGDFWSILSALFFGIHMLRTEHYSRLMKKDKFLALLGYEIFVIALFSAIWYCLRNDIFDVPLMSLEDIDWMGTWEKIVALPWLPILYTGIFSTGFCLWAELAAMRDVSATETAIIYGLEPLWGAAFAWFLLGERWGSTGWLGALLILGGSLTVQIFGSSPEKPSTQPSSSSSKLEEGCPNPNGHESLNGTKRTLNTRVTQRSRLKSSKLFKR
eukprot:Gb_08975 [translate_table: standard]